MAVAFRQIVENFIFSNGPFTSLALGTFSSAQTAGNRNVVLVQWIDAQGLSGVQPTISDTLGNVYTQIGPTQASSHASTFFLRAAFECRFIKGGTNAVTVNWTGSTTVGFPGAGCSEYAGTDTSRASYGYATNFVAGLGPAEVTLTPTSIGDVLVGWCGLNNEQATGALNTLRGTILSNDSLWDEYTATSLAAHAVGGVMTASVPQWAVTGIVLPQLSGNALFFGVP